MSPAVQACSHSSMKVSSPHSYIKKIKIIWKKIKNLSYKLQISLSSTLCLIVPIYSEIPAFYRQKPRGERREKIGGENAPPTKVTKSRKRNFSSVFAAWLWPGGHSRGVVPPGFAFWLYLQLAFLFQLLDLTKRSLIIGFNHLIWEDSFQPVFNLSNFSRSALISWFWIYLN